MVEKEHSEDEADSYDEKNSRETASILSVIGIVGGSTEIASRFGIDRHSEAGFAEKAHGEAYAKGLNGKLVESETSVFAPDAGIDVEIETEAGPKYLQSKHFEERIGNSTLKQYADIVDAIGATNGLKESADPDAYDLDVITREDWSFNRRAQEKIVRALRGYHRGFAALKNGAGAAVRSITGSAKTAAKRAVSGGRLLIRNLTVASAKSAAWFARRSLSTQLVLTVGTIFLCYLLWNWYSNEKEQGTAAYAVEMIDTATTQIYSSLSRGIKILLVLIIFSLIIYSLKFLVGAMLRSVKRLNLRQVILGIIMVAILSWIHDKAVALEDEILEEEELSLL